MSFLVCNITVTNENSVVPELCYNYTSYIPEGADADDPVIQAQARKQMHCEVIEKLDDCYSWCKLPMPDGTGEIWMQHPNPDLTVILSESCEE